MLLGLCTCLQDLLDIRKALLKSIESGDQVLRPQPLHLLRQLLGPSKGQDGEDRCGDKEKNQQDYEQFHLRKMPRMRELEHSRLLATTCSSGTPLLGGTRVLFDRSEPRLICDLYGSSGVAFGLECFKTNLYLSETGLPGLKTSRRRAVRSPVRRVRFSTGSSAKKRQKCLSSAS